MKYDIQSRLIHHIESALGEAIGSLTGKEFTIAWDEGATDPPLLEDAITWQQAFSVVEGPSFWIAAGRDLWESLGKITLEAAGIEEVTDEDCRSTWQEILQLTIAGVAAAMTTDQNREVTASLGSEIDVEPPGLTWLVFSVIDTSNKAWSFKVSWTAELVSLYAPGAEDVHGPAARGGTSSKTFDLLLEVALPITVSFGRTSMQIREVLKLNTGSIVELERFVSDPVEVIVNDCVIARGEVVVVDGNYGVRISQLASREDRLRTGITEAAHNKGSKL